MWCGVCVVCECVVCVCVCVCVCVWCVCLYRGIVKTTGDNLPVQYSLTDLGDGV